jgi:hypothetical protein
MDEMDISSSPDSGTKIVCKRWLRAARDAQLRSTWDVGVATRALGFGKDNGDAFVVREWDGKLLVGVIDGLGHGLPARQAAIAAQRYVESHHHMALDKLFAGTGRACRGTRGVVMALARFELSRIHFASLGNIEVRVLSRNQRVQFHVLRGIVGFQELNVPVQQQAWQDEWLFLLHSDGVSTQWRWEDFPGLEHEPPQTIATKLLHALAKTNDDATVLVARRSMA